MNKPHVPLNLFYEEPDPDRWLPFDRYPRKLVRRLVRGKPRPGGVMMVALELMRGLDRLGISYRFNDYGYIRRHPEEIACIIGKPQLLRERRWANPIIFGAGIFSHPVDFPDFVERYPQVKKILVPGDWMKAIFDPAYGADRVVAWPVGIDTERWSPEWKISPPTVDFLVYDKVRWEHERYEEELIRPIFSELGRGGYTHETIRYGHYTHRDLREKLSRAGAVIFLCEHETQGLAYQQILATGTPVLAWDRGGLWRDPAYFPHRVEAGPVSSVPYWDERCGVKFTAAEDFPAQLQTFRNRWNAGDFEPRQYILDHLTLEKAARAYVDIFMDVQSRLT